MENLAEKWLRTEIELNQRHEVILSQREALLGRHKEILKKHELKTRRLNKEFETAKERNQKILQEMELFEKMMQGKRQQDGTVSEFDLYKARYWEMVKSELSSL